MSLYRSSWGCGRWPAGSRELCTGDAALEPPILTESPFLSCCQAPGAVQGELWTHLSVPLGALPFLPDLSAPCRPGTFPVPPSPSCCFCSLQFHQLIKDWALVSSWWENRGRLSAGWDFPMGECQLLAPAERASPIPAGTLTYLPASGCRLSFNSQISLAL